MKFRAENVINIQQLSSIDLKVPSIKSLVIGGNKSRRKSRAFERDDFSKEIIRLSRTVVEQIYGLWTFATISRLSPSFRLTAPRRH